MIHCPGWIMAKEKAKSEAQQGNTGNESSGAAAAEPKARSTDGPSGMRDFADDRSLNRDVASMTPVNSVAKESTPGNAASSSSGSHTVGKPASGSNKRKVGSNAGGDQGGGDDNAPTGTGASSSGETSAAPAAAPSVVKVPRQFTVSYTHLTLPTNREV